MGRRVNWNRVKAMVVRWAGSDDGADDIADLLGPDSDRDPSTKDEFWTEFKQRLDLAFSNKVTSELLKRERNRHGTR